jgi:hypothetical protein
MDSFLSLPCVSSAAFLCLYGSALHRRQLDARLGAFLRTRPSELNGQPGFNFAQRADAPPKRERSPQIAQLEVREKWGLMGALELIKRKINLENMARNC